jgi:rhodanese-related sulfurtransferase
MIEEIDLKKMQSLVDAGALLVDCREDEEVAEGMIPGAKHVALSEIHEQKAEIPSDKDVVFYCRSGKRSMKACEIVEEWTDKNLYSVAGGYLAYQEENS